METSTLDLHHPEAPQARDGFSALPIDYRDLKDKLQISEAIYKGLVNSLPAAVYTCDSTGRITFFNAVAEQLWGYKPDIEESAINFCACYKVWSLDGQFIPPDQTPMAMAVRHQQSFRNVEAIVERPDGSRFYAAVNIDPIYDENNKPLGAVNVFQDITALKENELKLKQSQQNYEGLIQALAAPVYTTDVDGYIVLFNEAAANMWGRTPRVGVDRWSGAFKVFTPDNQELTPDQYPIAIALREGRAVVNAHVIVEDYHGNRCHVSVNPRPLFGLDGQIIGTVNMLFDITDQINAQQILETEVERRTNALKNSNRDLEQFAYVASHDLQEPLRKISTYASFVERDIADSDQVKKHLIKITNSAKRMTRLIRDILDYSRIDKTDAVYEAVDLNEIVASIIQEYEVLIAEKTASIEYNNLPVVRGIPHQLQQVFSNLISNSLKFGGDRASVITLSAQHMEEGYHVNGQLLDPAREYVVITLTDNGRGFDNQQAENIFTLFKRLDTEQKGSGVGLAICKKIVEAHGGMITASGVVGVGAIFSIVLPVD